MKKKAINFVEAQNLLNFYHTYFSDSKSETYLGYSGIAFSYLTYYMTETQTEQYKTLLAEVEQKIFKELEESYKSLLADNRKIRKRRKTAKETLGDIF